MCDLDEDALYYITLQNESYPMPAMPEGVKEGILQGLYRYRAAEARLPIHVRLLGSGSILNEAIRAQGMLADRYGVSSDVWSVTSYEQLRKDALGCERHNLLHPEAEARVPYLGQALGSSSEPCIAVSDYVRLHVERIARWIPGRVLPLGTDGFGLSDTRQVLRRHFEVDAESIVVAALSAAGKPPAEVARAIAELGIDPEQIDPMRR
jgi:pyruvate dehydrogenase E1 component